MARTLDFQYIYPYSVWNANSKYSMDYDTSRTSLGGNYTYPLSFHVINPYIVRAKISVSAENISGVSILNRSWYLYLYNGSWRTLATFTMPSTGAYTWEGAVGYSGVQKFAAVPASTMSTGTEWNLGISIDELTVQETITTTDLATTDYFTAFPNYGGVGTRPTRIYANIDGTLVAAKKVLANVDGVLTELPPAYSGAYTTTTPDSMRLYEFMPPSTATYKFEVAHYAGDHEARLYDAAFAALNDGNSFYSGSFALTGGNLYYISLTHYLYNSATADSVLFITKT
jgi:hypothetical protein